MDYTQTAGFDPQALKQSFSAVKSDVSQLASQLQGGYRQLDTQLRDFANEKPLILVGAAFGVGFVLGGGIFSRLFAAALAAGVRAAIAQSLPSIPEMLMGQAGQPGDGAGQAAPDRTTGAYGL